MRQSPGALGVRASYAVLGAEEPTWVRYGIDGSGKLAELARMSLASLGSAQIDYGNVYIDETTAV